MRGTERKRESWGMRNSKQAGLWSWGIDAVYGVCGIEGGVLVGFDIDTIIGGESGGIVLLMTAGPLMSI